MIWRARGGHAWRPSVFFRKKTEMRSLANLAKEEHFQVCLLRVMLSLCSSFFKNFQESFFSLFFYIYIQDLFFSATIKLLDT